jgi:hypothetical protein
MRRNRPWLLILCWTVVAWSAAAASSFSFEGFRLGMSRAEATRLQPGASWTETSPWMGRKGHGPRVVAKTFTGSHLGKTALVSVVLDDKAEAVHSITFVFSSPSNATCAEDALEARGLLKRTYGVETEAVDDPPRLEAKWRTKDGLTVFWQSSCRYGYTWYSVTYS